MMKAVSKYNTPGTVICRCPNATNHLLFHNPKHVIVCNKLADLPETIDQLQALLGKGHYLAGFISYEASPAFDPANQTCAPADTPLLWMGVYSSPPEALDLASLHSESQDTNATSGIEFTPELTEADYLDRIRTIKRYIYDGDIYQANFTFRCHAPAIEHPFQRFIQLTRSHPVPYAAYVHTGEQQILSLSPELFCECNQGGLLSLPMKGTAPRAPLPDDDLRVIAELQVDQKNRAENVMIVDMVRHDFGRLCEFGSITVDPLCHVDTYRTVHQMISGVHGTLREPASLYQILSAIYPAASITGAPKIRAMQIINELELSPRGVYTGTVGCILPNGDFCLNVAIRTLVCSRNRTELGIGSGIVADSVPEAEWHESLLKMQFANTVHPDFDVLETMLWDRTTGIHFRDEHLERARTSQHYFRRQWDQQAVEQALADLPIPPDTEHARVRLLIGQNGQVKTEAIPLTETGWKRHPAVLTLAAEPTDSSTTFLYHKTTNRETYNNAFRQAVADGFDEVIFRNERGEVTEGAISNIFIRKNGKWLTPPLKCGLLNGIWRSKMIDELNAAEQILSLDDLQNAETILVGNSVRGKVEAKLDAARED